MLNYKLLMQQVYHCHCDYPSNKILNIHWFHSNNDILQGLLTRILLISPLPSGKHTKTLNYHRVSLTIVIIRYCLYALASGNPTGQARKSSRNGGFFLAIKGELSIATLDSRRLHPWIYPLNHHNKTSWKKTPFKPSLNAINHPRYIHVATYPTCPYLLAP